jgi:hypothetical protein
MADSTAYTTIIEDRYDEIVTKKTGKISSADAEFLLLYRIMELLEDIKENTAT